ncbi:hypothetical protein HU200_064520 [Digitaria exilis]|uniref:DUF4220 domain-containing protein n=1 Tax=Digitaria exilis TaxID=1010633 RepID=A0A835ABF6_9POAL|nr:hypothetical protein HU200_064520 [Digitaria exilis]
MLHLWNEWEIQILVLVSFALQVFLLVFAWLRRRSISPALGVLVWLMYLLAEYTATYTLGHMSIGCKEADKKQQQLMAFWAPFLLVHLGGQDTITAYAIEDSQLWLRHLLTFTVQAFGAAYVLYKGIRGPLVTPSAVMFLVGVLKNGERVWALGFSRLDIIRRYLDGVSIKQNHNKVHRESSLDDECVLQGAHDLLYICMGQFVDDKIWPSVFQKDALDHFSGHRRTIDLAEMQLSLMCDIFYTKAAVIHTWYGRCVRAMSLLGTAAAFFLFRFSKDSGYNRVDVAVTDILELVLEEIQRMVKACAGKEDVMSSYRGQCSLERLDGYNLTAVASTTGTEFDQSILTWHLATHKLLSKSTSSSTATDGDQEAIVRQKQQQQQLVEATRVVSNYMMFLLVERPHMLPSPVRPTLHLKARQQLMERPHSSYWYPSPVQARGHNTDDQVVTLAGAQLGDQLVQIKESGMTELTLLRVVLGIIKYDEISIGPGVLLEYSIEHELGIRDASKHYKRAWSRIRHLSLDPMDVHMLDIGHRAALRAFYRSPARDPAACTL